VVAAGVDGRDQDKRQDSVRMPKRESQRDTRAGGNPSYHGSTCTDVIQQSDYVVRKLIERQRARAPRLATAAKIRRNHAVSGAQRCDERQCRPVVGHSTVQHHYRFAVTVLDREQMDATAFEPELSHSILPWLNARQSFKSAWSPKKTIASQDEARPFSLGLFDA
jgi:hypothetical protein